MIENLKDVYIFLRKYFRPIATLTLLIEFPYILIGRLSAMSSSPFATGQGSLVIFFAFALVIFPFSTGAQISLYEAILNGKALRIKQCLSESLTKLPMLMVGAVVYLFLTTLGLMAFIIPGIIVAVRLSFFGFFIMYEKMEPIPALKKSWAVTRQYFVQMLNPLVALTFLINGSQLLIQGGLQQIGISSVPLDLVIDSFYAVIGWASLILVFRFYCQYRQEIEQIPDIPTE